MGIEEEPSMKIEAELAWSPRTLAPANSEGCQPQVSGRWMVLQIAPVAILWLLLTGVAIGSSGCVLPEREVAKRIDMTPEIVRQASQLLAADPELGRFPIVVDGFKNDMRVKGHVATAAQKERAARIVWAVRGVRSVENDLQVDAQVGGASPR